MILSTLHAKREEGASQCIGSCLPGSWSRLPLGPFPGIYQPRENSHGK